MKDCVTIFILARAMGKERPRFGRGRVYTPKRTTDYEAQVARCAVLAMRGREIMTGAIQLQIHVRYTPPKSWSKKDKKESYGKIKTSKPDFDNIEKALTDPLSGIVWKDDAQVGITTFTKFYGLKDFIEITIREIDT